MMMLTMITMVFVIVRKEIQIYVKCQWVLKEENNIVSEGIEKGFTERLFLSQDLEEGNVFKVRILDSLGGIWEIKSIQWSWVGFVIGRSGDVAIKRGQGFIGQILFIKVRICGGFNFQVSWRGFFSNFFVWCGFIVFQEGKFGGNFLNVFL